MSIIIGGDLVPTKTNYQYFADGRLDKLLDKKLIEMLESADFRIFNLETPLTDCRAPIKKIGGALSAPSKTINAIKKMQIDLFTLANNHIMDQGSMGLKSTCEILKNAGIDFVGAGDCVTEAMMPYVFKYQEKNRGLRLCRT